MTKTRISISLEPDQAQRIRACAAETGQDLSAFVAAGALAYAAHHERTREIFADIDAAIDAADIDAADIDLPPDAVDPGEEERIRAEIAAARARHAQASRGNAA